MATPVTDHFSRQFGYPGHSVVVDVLDNAQEQADHPRVFCKEDLPRAGGLCLSCHVAKHPK